MMEPMKYELEELLYQMGIYLVQAGYAVVVEAAALAVEEPERLQSLTQEFYPEVGSKNWTCCKGGRGEPPRRFWGYGRFLWGYAWPSLQQVYLAAGRRCT